MSNEVFFKEGMIIATIKVLGNCARLIEQLIIRVIWPTNESKQCFKMLAGIGSVAQDLVLDVLTISLVSTKLNNLKLYRCVEQAVVWMAALEVSEV